MVFNPVNRSYIVSTRFPKFIVGGVELQYVDRFKYLGHIITDTFTDDDDINREIRNMFVRVNILIRKFSKCSKDVKRLLFKSYCICLYDISLWKYFSKCKMNKLRSCYIKCIKSFFGYKRCDSVTNMFFDLQLPSFDTSVANSCFSFKQRWLASNNGIVAYISGLQIDL